MLTTLTPAYTKAFVLECAKAGLPCKVATELLWQTRMNEALENPSFAEGFIGELQKTAGDPGLLERIDASLADKGSLGKNVAHYGGRGAIAGTAMSLLPLLSKKYRAKGIGNAVKWLTGGATAGGILGGGYGAKKTTDNSLAIDDKALNPLWRPATPGAASSSSPGGAVDIYTTGGLRFGNQPAAGSGTSSSQAPGALSDTARRTIDEANERIRRYEIAKGAPSTGSASGDYARNKAIEEQIAAERKRSEQASGTLDSLKVEQSRLEDNISKALPYVTGRSEFFRDKADAAGKPRGWLTQQVVNLIGGQDSSYDPVWNYKLLQDRADIARQNMEDSRTNPTIYR